MIGGARTQVIRASECSLVSLDTIVRKLAFSFTIMFWVCFSPPGLSLPPPEEYSLELQDIFTENHDSVFKRWSRKPIGFGLAGGYSLCEDGFLLTTEKDYINIIDLNIKRFSQKKIKFNNYALISCLGAGRDGGLIVFSKKTNALLGGEPYRILHLGSKIVEISPALDYYYDNDGVLKIICNDEICLNSVYTHMSMAKGFETIKGRKISADVKRNFLLMNIDLKGYNTYLKIVNGVVNPSKLFCAPYQPPFLIEAQEIELCAKGFQKYIYASQSIFIDNFVIIKMDDPPALDEICDRKSNECRPLPLGSADPFGFYRIKGNTYYQYGNNEWGLGPFTFCKNKINKDCFDFEIKNEEILQYFEVNDKRFTISVEYKIENPEDVFIGAHYINYAPKRSSSN